MFRVACGLKRLGTEPFYILDFGINILDLRQISLPVLRRARLGSYWDLAELNCFGSLFLIEYLRGIHSASTGSVLFRIFSFALFWEPEEGNSPEYLKHAQSQPTTTGQGSSQGDGKSRRRGTKIPPASKNPPGINSDRDKVKAPPRHSHHRTDKQRRQRTRD